VVVGEVPSATDVLVIGGGPAGYVAALRAADLGKSVTLVERSRIGGVCLNEGCIPSKALIQVAEIAALGGRAAEWGLRLDATVDMPRVQEWISRLVARLTRGVSGLLDSAGVNVLRGTARFTNARRAVVAGDGKVEHIEFDHAVVASGSQPVALPEMPFDGQRILDSTSALSLAHVPERLAVIGGGYIGVEVGTVFAKLGASVTILEAADRLLPTMSAALGRSVERSLRAAGAEVLLGATPIGVDEAVLVAHTKAGEHKMDADAVVVAVGRRPCTEDLGLESLGVRREPSGHIPVDPARRASATVLAVGDVTSGPALAHKAMAEGEVAARTAARLSASFDPSCVPAVVYSDPEIATVGLSPEEARAGGADVDVFRFPLTGSARALILGQPEGFVEMVTERSGGAIVGVHMAGPGVSELAAEAALAVEMGATAEDLAWTIHPHPTLSEALADSARGVAGRPLHARVVRAPPS
jgi:dihydrolipoyl dehydrogenase